MVLSGTYRRRNPEQSSFYQCLESYWEEFRESYPYFYEKDYGPLRAVVERTVTRFLECGIFRHGFARVRCAHCHHEYLLAFSCKTRYFCPSCQAKRVAAFVEWVNEEILEPVDHRQYVWTIPRVLRPSFAGTRLQFDPQEGQIEYHTSKGIRRRMDALDWIALVTSHIPDVHEQMVRYYGRYSNASRGKRKKATNQRLSQPSAASSSAESDSEADRFSRERRRNWARFLKKIYEIDPLRGFAMEIIAFIEQPAVIRKILRHLQLWQRPPRSPPPPLFPDKLEAFLASLTPRQAQQIRASTDSIFWDDVPVFRD